MKLPIVEYKKEALVTRMEAMAAEDEVGKCVEVVHANPCSVQTCGDRFVLCLSICPSITSQ